MFYLKRSSPFPGATVLYWLLQTLGTLSARNEKLFVAIFQYIYIYLTGLGRVFEGQRTLRGYGAGQALGTAVLWELIPSSPFLKLFLFYFANTGAHRQMPIFFFFFFGKNQQQSPR